MKKCLYHFAFLTCLSLVFFTSCSKDDAGDNKKPIDEKPIDENPSKDPCLQMSAFKIEPVTPVLLGGEIQIFCDTVQGADYLWSGPGGFSSYAQNPVISYSAKHFMEGWYSVRITHDSCTTIEDSVYVDVMFPQGTPDCELTDNEVSINGLISNLPAGIRSVGPSVFGFEIQAGGMYLDIYMRMSDYWATRELEDGIYYTTNEPAPEDANKINIRIVTRNVSFTADANSLVYISHVGGKVRVSLCVPITDTQGYGIKTTMTGQFTED